MTISRRLSPQLAHVSADSILVVDSLSSGSTHSQQDCRKHVVVKSSSMKRSKSVQFAAQEAFSTTKLIESADDFSLDTRRELWWTSEELKEFSKERKDLVKQFVADQQEQRQQEDDATVDKKIAALYKHCSSLNVSQVLRSKANKQLLVDMADVRGLEGKLSRSISRHRKQHVQSILSMVGQQQQQQGDSGQFLLSAKAAQSSRTSQILARVLALADAKQCM
jgi:hypothetical protein